MRSRRWSLSILAILALATLGVSATGAGAADSRPTPAELDEGLLTLDDLLPAFEETDRRPLDAATLASDVRGPCNGPNTMAHAVALDSQVDVVTAAFGTESGASLTEDVFSFKDAKRAESFLKKNTKQLKSCDTWKGLLQGETRTFDVSSIRVPKLGDQALEANVVIAPTSSTAKGFAGKLIRQTTYVRLGSVVASLLYLRSVDFSSSTPGSGYPKSAVKSLKDAL